jgi:hypothetical protein
MSSGVDSWLTSPRCDGAGRDRIVEGVMSHGTRRPPASPQTLPKYGIVNGPSGSTAIRVSGPFFARTVAAMSGQGMR